MLFTPTGRLPSSRWRRFVIAITGGAAVWVVSTLLTDRPPDPPLEAVRNPMAISSIEVPLLIAGAIGIVLTHGGVLVAGVSLVRRARRATGVERQQLRWVGFGGAVAGVAVVAALLSALADQPALLNVAAAALVIVLPLSVTIAVSRYRLYDLDRVISRSVLYTVLTIAVAAVYAIVVAGLSLVAGDSRVVSGVAAVVAAMTVAPMRSFAQGAIDRFLFGRRAEPFAVVSGLSRRLQESTSADTALQALVDTVAADLRLPFVAVEAHDGALLAFRGTRSKQRTDRLALSHRGEDVGALVLGLRGGEDEFDQRERALLEDLARHAGAAVSAVLVARDLHAARHRLVAAREEERRRLRRDLHDGLGPQLTAVTLKVDAARNLMRHDPDQADAVMAELRADVRAAIEDVRRVVYALRPPGLDELGLLGALRQHARACTSTGAPLQVDVVGDDLDGLSAPVEVAAYRIVTEAITNTVRHARARRCDVRVARDGDLVVEISDDGVGLPPRWRAGVGVTSMRERAVELGGSCTIETGDGGLGTTVSARLPMTSAAP
jgi:signal transduction histidine kinase